MKFKKIRLKEISDITMGQSPKGSSYNNKKIGIPFLQGNRTFGRTYPYIDTWTTEPKKISIKNSILMSVRAPVGEINIANQDICIGRGLCSIQMKNGNNKYLYYLLMNSVKEIKKRSIGTVFEAINKKELEEIEVINYNEKYQHKIVKILSNIDKKIELNNHIINTLLEIINCIYKDTFKYTAYHDKAENIATITIGKTPPRNEKACFTKNKNDIKWISISDLGKCSTYIFNTTERLTLDSIKKYNVKILPKDTIILSFKLTIGRVGITTEEMATNEAIAHFRLKNEEMKYYLYSYLKNFDYIKLGSTSSIATAVNSKIIKGMPIDIPNDKTLNDYNKKIYTMFEKILENERQNQTLHQLRNILLSKVINGEIDLEKIEI